MARNACSALVLTALVAGAPSARGADGAPVVVGLLLPPDEPEAAGIRQGTLAAAEEANESPGPRVTVAVRGKTGAWGSDASEAALLVMDDAASALIAPPSGTASHLVLQVSGRTAVPVASLCPDASVTRTSIPWMVRVVPSTRDEARALFAGTPPASRWLVFVPPGRAGREAAHDLSSSAVAGGRSIVRTVETDGRFPDAALREIVEAARPDAILVWLDAAPASRLVRSLREAGFTGTLAGPMRLASPAFSREAGSSADGLLVPAAAAGGGAAASAFASRYRRLFGTEPGLAAASAHDAAKLLIDTLRKRGSQGARRAFPPAEHVSGATGALAFDRHGNRLVSLQVLRYRDGRLVRG
ncbi:MAG TPA: ABC transporter substrate-binding protein [Thermoanaerobaculia bacterium]|nr:ABC transporter substrate-binding protein [Thermoanaerobaculia bacterium]